jgi:hypothetical protein
MFLWLAARMPAPLSGQTSVSRYREDFHEIQVWLNFFWTLWWFAFSLLSAIVMTLIVLASASCICWPPSGTKWQEIGRGNFSRVFKVLNRIDGCLYAVKRSQHALRMTSERSHSSPLAVLCKDILLVLLCPVSYFFPNGYRIVRSWKLVPIWLVFTRIP